ncbi:hypothetical protein ACIBIZ_46490 [Nonomuraea spiralis]|uniref:effector-associated constant component EACC1 n=1 Tax=Nonomuraea TaxID=83681 RepID=UPI000F7BA20A|nr:hypothetical protein [Nonomuraea sp. WAC 01424]
MDILVVVDGEERSDELYSLRKEFSDDVELAGIAQDRISGPPADALGDIADALIIALAPGGLVTAAAAVLVTWIRNRKRSVSITLKRPDNAELRFQAETVRAIDGAKVREITAELAKWLNGEDAEVPATGRGLGPGDGTGPS